MNVKESLPFFLNNVVLIHQQQPHPLNICGEQKSLRQKRKFGTLNLIALCVIQVAFFL